MQMTEYAMTSHPCFIYIIPDDFSSHRIRMKSHLITYVSRYIRIRIYVHTYLFTYVYGYGVPTRSRLLKMIGFVCKKAL